MKKTILAGAATSDITPEMGIQLAGDIKRQAPTRHTLVAHFCNGYAGYVPTRRAFDGGGYETRTGAGSKLPVNALERVTAAATQLLVDAHRTRGSRRPAERPGRDA